MYKTRVGASADGAKAQLGYAETDPSGRYGRVSQFLASEIFCALIFNFNVLLDNSHSFK
ncbi:hypothetical protein OIU78_001597 [Salix suchowensis]|nr:hypothetical protein OIU78_001597 [Salix suchowensis]